MSAQQSVARIRIARHLFPQGHPHRPRADDRPSDAEWETCFHKQERDASLAKLHDEEWRRIIEAHRRRQQRYLNWLGEAPKGRAIAGVRLARGPMTVGTRFHSSAT